MIAFTRLRRVGRLVAAVITTLALVGATYQGIVTSLERRAFPYPGRLVDVGDHQLHLACSGKGAPTVVLEASGGGFSSTWAWVQEAVSRTARVCSYDRAGLGWSQAGDEPLALERVPDELRTLLGRASEPAPFVVVGYGFGATLARLFAARHRADTLALVLVDEASETAPPLEQPLVGLGRGAPWLARVGILRLTALLARHGAGLPEGAAAGAARAFLNRPDHLTRATQELAGRELALAAIARSTIGAVQVVAISTTSGDDLMFLNEARSRMVTDAIERVPAATRVAR